ncbi:MAG: 8-amino-7-oxononanoate synthase [Verrucomicrobium sp.]|nr:8-amino-7-oxononanoate synthase [Verrucomicrobium sp.]
MENDLAAREAAGLRRRLAPPADGLSRAFCTNDYLGLSRHPRLIEAAREAAARYGAGAGASRLAGGNLEPHAALDEALAAFKGRPAALSFSSGYAAALGTIPALAGKEDAVLLDKRAHASLIDGARLSGATLRVFPHNDLDYLEKLLQKTAAPKYRRTLIVTESVFSMDGDLAPLRALADLKDRHGAWLLVDEAHSTGIYGPGRRGLAEAEGLTGRIEVQLGTLSKALGTSGGFVAGSRALVDTLLNHARSLIYSTGPNPAACGAARAALDLAASEEGERLCRRLWENAARFGALTGLSSPSPIFPVLCGAEERAVAAQAALAAKGFQIPAIRYPTVARGQARLRVTLTAAAAEGEIAALADALRNI